jgi:hypothetical protein
MSSSTTTTAEEVDLLTQEHNALARQLRETQIAYPYVALTRLTDAVRAGDIDAMRAAYSGIGGFHLGLGAVHGHTEYIVLRETLRNEAVPLDLLGVFFRELGGRFIIDAQYDVCVFSELVMLDEEHQGFHYADREAEKERWSMRMAEIVRYLVDELRMPILMQYEYRLRPFTTRTGTLLQLAWDTHSWACYFAFARYIPRPRTDAACLERCVTQDNAYHRYWARRLALEINDDHVVWGAIRGTETANPALFNELAAPFRDRREHMQVLLFLQESGPENAAARRVMADISPLSHMIHTLAFADAPF